MSDSEEEHIDSEEDPIDDSSEEESEGDDDESEPSDDGHPGGGQFGDEAVVVSYEGD